MMQHRLIQYLTAWLFLLMAGGTAMAQDDFDPVNPPEPQMLNRIRVVAVPEDAAYVSGAGQYTTGTTVTLRTSRRSADYTFRCWMADGEVCSEEMEFDYVVGSGNKVFTAVYDYNPESPAEPTLISKRRIYLECDPADACSFNRASGEKAEVGQSQTIRAYANQGFVFRGWYRGDVKLSDSNPFAFTTPDEDVTLTACFEFDPDSPGDPQGGQEGVDNPDVQPGDVNGDGLVDIVDVAWLISHLLGSTPEGFVVTAADVNTDTTVDAADVTAVVNLILNK